MAQTHAHQTHAHVGPSRSLRAWFLGTGVSPQELVGGKAHVSRFLGLQAARLFIAFGEVDNLKRFKKFFVHQGLTVNSKQHNPIHAL